MHKPSDAKMHKNTDIGAAVILAWGVTVLLGVITDGYLYKGAFPFEQTLQGFIYTRYQTAGFKFFAVMSAANVMFGTLVQVASRQYALDKVD